MHESSWEIVVLESRAGKTDTNEGEAFPRKDSCLSRWVLILSATLPVILSLVCLCVLGSSWAWGLVVESVLRPQLQSPLLCPGPLLLQTSPGTETLPGANTAPAHYFPALAACPGSSQARLWESSSAGTREGQGGAPSRRPDPGSRQRRAGPR